MSGPSLEATVAEVMGILGLPVPSFRFPASLAQWAVREEILFQQWRRRSPAVQWAMWWSLRRAQPFHPLARREYGDRLCCLARWERRDGRFWLHHAPRFEDLAAVLRALEVLDAAGGRFRRTFATAERAWCLATQALLLGPSLGNWIAAREKAGQAQALAEAGDWRVRAAVSLARPLLWEAMWLAAVGGFWGPRRYA